MTIDDTFSQMGMLMGAMSVGREELTVRGVIDREGAIPMIESLNAFLFDIVYTACSNECSHR